MNEFAIKVTETQVKNRAGAPKLQRQNKRRRQTFAHQANKSMCKKKMIFSATRYIPVNHMKYEFSQTIFLRVCYPYISTMFMNGKYEMSRMSLDIFSVLNPIQC